MLNAANGTLTSLQCTGGDCSRFQATSAAFTPTGAIKSKTAGDHPFFSE